MFWDLINSDNDWADVLRSRVSRSNGFIRHHIFSSIWSGIKEHSQVILENTTWLLGDGTTINFWLHNWSGSPLATLFNIPQHFNLQFSVSEFILDRQWNVSLELQNMFPNLLAHLNRISIPIEYMNDKILWMHTTTGDLSLKEAYQHFSPSGNIVSWAKLLWNLAIPPSKSFMVWRLFCNKLATDDNLAVRGFHLPSMCSLCNMEPETSVHLFLHCPFALSLWNWLASVINLNIDLSSFVSVLSICNRGWNPQCKVTIAAAVIFIYNAIWNCRNQYRYQNIKPNLKSIISFICTSVSLAGSYNNLVAGPSMTDFEILKFFKINIHRPKAPKIIEVIWNPPLHGWLKCNTDGASLGNPGSAASAGIFRNHKGESVGCFAKNIGIANAFFAELMVVILAIECAADNHWNHLWIENDSKLVVLAIKSVDIVPWQLKNRWLNCLVKSRQMRFMISHVYREGNFCADMLASLGVSLDDYTWWSSPPLCIKEELTRNMLGLPNYRFS